MLVAHLHPDLANQCVAWLLEEAEHDRQAAQASRARRRRRLTRRAFAPRAVHQHAGAR